MSDTRDQMEGRPVRMDSGREGSDGQAEPRKDGEERGGPGGQRRGKGFFKKKVCKFCTQKIKVDYKDVDVMRRFVTERGKILPRRITGTCAKHQRVLAVGIKRARALAFLPYVAK
jgi:small subunit ribosomal protein S18